MKKGTRIPRVLKAAVILIACVLCLCILCFACTNYLLQTILPDDPGNRDWRYLLPNGYEIWHLNSEQTALVKEGWSNVTNVVVDKNIVAFREENGWVGLKCKSPQSDTQEADDRTLYYLVNTAENELQGPLTEQEYRTIWRAETKTDPEPWIRTSPRPDGARYD